MKDICDKIHNTTIFVLRDDDNHSENLSDLEEVDESKASDFFPCKLKNNSTVYIAKQYFRKGIYFLFGKKYYDQELQLLAIIFPMLEQEEWENTVPKIFGKCCNK